jgi:hypothetical protein
MNLTIAEAKLDFKNNRGNELEMGHYVPKIRAVARQHCLTCLTHRYGSDQKLKRKKMKF